MKLPIISLSLVISLFLQGVSWAGYEYYQVDDNAILHYEQGQQWMELGEPRYAIGEFQTAIALKPSANLSAPIYNNLGQAFLVIEAIDKAIIAFQNAIELDPHNHVYYAQLVKAYGKANVQMQAANELVDQLTDNPNDESAWYLLGLLYEALNYGDYALEAYQNVVLIAPEGYIAEAAQYRLKQMRRQTVKGA